MSFNSEEKRLRQTRILFVSQVYTPSHDAISQMIGDLAAGLSTVGYEVHVLTAGVNYMTGERLPLHAVMDGVRVWRVPAPSVDRHRPAGRMVGYAGFFLLSAAALQGMPKPDVVVYLSVPPFIGWSGGMMRRMASARTVYWAQDVYPDVPQKMGVLRNRRLLRFLDQLDRAIVTGMDAVVAIGDGMARVFETKGVAPANIRTIPNWSVVRGDAADRESSGFRADHGLEGKLVVQYSGNMGVVHDMAPIAEAMRLTREESDLHWLMIGDGKRRGELEGAVQRHRVTNATFLPYQPLETLGAVLRAADVALISLRSEMEGLVVPSKLYGIMAAGVPIVFIGDPEGEVANVISTHNCGYSVGGGEELVAALFLLKNNASLRNKMGRNARTAYETHFSRERAIERFDALFRKVAAS